MSAASPLLLVAAAVPPQAGDDAALYAGELATALAANLLTLSPSDLPPPVREARVVARRPGESARQAWFRALDEVQPRLVFVLGLGELPPDALLELREREIRYALFMLDYQQICPTRRLWHRSQQVCGGPGPGGVKCGWCVSAGRSLLEVPAHIFALRHYPRHWETAMAGAEALVVASRSLRDAWIAHQAPPERLIVVPPFVPRAEPPPPSAAPRSRSLVYAGGWDEAAGAKLLAEALDAIGEPVTIHAVGALEPAAQAELRAAIPERHAIQFAGELDPPALDRLLAAAGGAVMPVRWQQTYGRMLDLAAWQGAPPIATAIGGIPERIIHGLNGYLSEPEDAGSLAEAIENALGNSRHERGWDAAAARRQVQTHAAAGLAELRRLSELLLADEPHAAARVEFDQPLAAAAEALNLEAEAAYGHLRSALESRAETEDPVELAFDQIAAAATRGRRVHLNHALACYHAAGTRSVLCLAGGTGDAALWFSAWGLDARNHESVAELAAIAQRLGARPAGGGFEPEAFFLDRRASTDLGELRRRFPGAAAVIAETPDGIQVL